MTNLLNAYAPPPLPGELPEEVAVHVLGDKFTHGGDDVDGTISLEEMLFEQFPCDAHFTMYTHPSCTRLLKGTRTMGIRFSIAVYDLDFDDHKSRPTQQSYEALIRTAHCLDYTPNVVYATRGGARFIYLIEDMTDDADLFEAHYQSLMAKIAEPLTFSGCPYQVDTQAKDWTRLFRCPWVTRDGLPEFNYHINLFHPGRLDLTSFTVKKPKELPPPATNQTYRGNDRRITTLLVRIREGSRNHSLFSYAAYVLSRYRVQDQDGLLDVARRQALNQGLSDREIEQTIKSAQRHVSRTNSSNGDNHD